MGRTSKEEWGLGGRGRGRKEREEERKEERMGGRGRTEMAQAYCVPSWL